MNSKVTIQLDDKVINLHFEEFEDNIDIDQLTRIDYSNLYAELITAPALMNRVGLLKAEADNAEAEARLERNIKMAEVANLIRKNAEGKRPTIAQIEEAVQLDPVVQNAQRKRLRKGKEAAYIDSLYWAVKSKEKKLDRIGEKMNLAPSEFEKHLVEGKWNGILIEARDKLIK